MGRKKRQNQWVQRRVALVASDAHHNIQLINIQMPVRIKERTAVDTIYEGPIQAAWDQVPESIRGQLDLVGALVASTDVSIEGRITWLKDSLIETAQQAGADRLRPIGVAEPVEVAAGG